MSRLPIWLKITITALFLALIDLISKSYAAAQFKQPLHLTSFLTFTYQQNTGIAWSIPIPHYILIPLNILLLAAIPVIAYKQVDLRYKINQWALAFIVGGAIGNVFDRLVFGYVRDFIAIAWWPVFNLADLFLCIGIFLLALFYGILKRS